MRATWSAKRSGASERSLRNARAGLLVIVLAASLFLLGALDVIYVGVAIDLLHKGQGWAGFLNSAAGVGALVGALLTVALVGRPAIGPVRSAAARSSSGRPSSPSAQPRPQRARPSSSRWPVPAASVSWMAGQHPPAAHRAR